MSSRLTAAEAAARLGVKKETLYAYVSRQILTRYRSDRRSFFDANEVDRLRAERRRRATGEVGVVVATRVADVSDEGLSIVGCSIDELVGFGWDSVIRRVLGTSPKAAPRWVSAAAKAQAALPTSATLLDRARASVTAIGVLAHDGSIESSRRVREQGASLVASVIGSLPRVGGGSRTSELSERLWFSQSKDRRQARRAALDTALVLLTDHGLATSTFGVRVAASTRADVCASVLAGLSTVGGSLHGASSATTHQLFQRAARVGVEQAFKEARERGPLPGVGHSVYSKVDPRADILFAKLRGAYDTRLVDSVKAKLAGDGVVNVDLALGALTFLSRMSPHAGEGFFAIARMVGWVAHYLEELAEPPLRFRVRARYVGS